MQEKLLRYMIDSEIIDPEDQAIYRYGMQQLKGSLISIGTTLLIGILFHAVWASICFAAAYIPLRSFAGGYHARTPAMCYLWSTLLTAGAVWLVKSALFDGIAMLIIVILADGILVMYAPVESENKPLSRIEKAQFRKKTVLILLAENLLMAAGYGMGWSIVTASIFMGIVCTAILILAAKKPDRIARRKRRWKKTERVSGRKRSAGC